MSGDSGVSPAVPTALSPGPSVTSKSTSTPSAPSPLGWVTWASMVCDPPVVCCPPPGVISRTIDGPPGGCALALGASTMSIDASSAAAMAAGRRPYPPIARWIAQRWENLEERSPDSSIGPVSLRTPQARRGRLRLAEADLVHQAAVPVAGALGAEGQSG